MYYVCIYIYTHVYIYMRNKYEKDTVTCNVSPLVLTFSKSVACFRPEPGLSSKRSVCSAPPMPFRKGT